MVHQDLTTLEAVALAIRSEMESTDLYQKLTKRVRNPEVKLLLEELETDEESHRETLMTLYRKLLAGEKPAIPAADGRDKQWDIDPDADYLTIMTKARDKEYESEDFYKSAAERVRDHKTRVFFMELAETEHRHAAVLQRQVDRLQEDPHWFDRQDSGFYKSTHEGP